MPGFTKLFQSILASTIWRSSDTTRLVWITLLAMADRNGVVEGSVPGLADFARVSLPDCVMSLKELQAPDEWSRSKVDQGRRIREIDGGWFLINYGEYRKKLSQDERREYLKLKQREYRQRNRKQVLTHVNNVSDKQTMLTQAEAEAEADKKEQALSNQPAQKTKQALRKLSSANADFEAFRQAYPVSRRTGGKDAKNAWKQAIKGRNGNHLSVMLTALEQHKRSEQWQIPKLIPLMTTWLNQERWTQVLPEGRISGRQFDRQTPFQKAKQTSHSSWLCSGCLHENPLNLKRCECGQTRP